MRTAILALLIAVSSFCFVACDENDPNFPAVEVTATAIPGDGVHGTVTVPGASPIPDIEIQFKDGEQ